MPLTNQFVPSVIFTDQPPTDFEFNRCAAYISLDVAQPFITSCCRNVFQTECNPKVARYWMRSFFAFFFIMVRLVHGLIPDQFARSISI